MDHKLQIFPLTSNGSNSVVRETPENSTSQIASNDAGLARVPASVEPKPEIASTENSQAANVAESRPATTLKEFVDSPRCDVARSAGYDPTGEHAVACGALAQLVCEYCGPMCASCAEETFCFYGEHKLTQLPDDGPLPERRQRRGRISEVVYVELKCPNCKRVRLALPKNHRPQRVRKCPVCKVKAPAEYLAHGFTRRRLPYHEVFTVKKELPEGVEFKQRMPWDRRPNWWVEEE